MRFTKGLGLFLALLIALGQLVEVQAASFSLPGVIPPSACRVGGVLSTDQFTTTGFSNVRTAEPNDTIVASAFVVANNFVPDTSIILAPNCVAPLGAAVDGAGMNIMAVKAMPTISSAAEADIQEVHLYWDVNVNGIWDPLLDLEMQSLPGEVLDSQDTAIFHFGPQNPIGILSNSAAQCRTFVVNAAPARGVGPLNGTNTRPPSEGCYMAFLIVVDIGDNPTTGSQFGLQIEVMAGDIPGSNGVGSYTVSSGLSSSRNPQGTSVRLHMLGGSPSSHTPIEHISNGSGSPESNAAVLEFTGGQVGEGLLTRFRAREVSAGTREAIAMAIGLCDGGFLANTSVPILPAIAGAPPSVAGGLASLPCVPSAGTDGFATGINGATLIFRGPLARYMGTVRMYVDECSIIGGSVPVAACGSPGAAGPVQPAVGAPTLVTDAGGGDGFLFQSGELTEQVAPIYNEQTGEAIAQFGKRQEQILFTGNGNPVAAGSDVACVGAGTCGTGGTAPLVIIWTVDIDSNSPGGIVDVLLGLQTFDDTAQNINPIGASPCVVYAVTAPGIPGAPAPGPGVGVPGACASNLLNAGPEIYSFSVEAMEHPSTPNNLAAFDTNGSCFLDDPEFFAMIDGWVDGQIGDDLFFSGVDAWVAQTNICDAAASNSVTSLSLDSITLETNIATSTTTFAVDGQGIDTISVDVFGLGGDVVFSDQSVGTYLTWNQTANSGAPVANGTYLYVVTVKDANGAQVISDVRKLVVIR